MATAGRRRALKKLQKLRDFMGGSGNTATTEVPDILVGFKPIQIKYLERRKRANSEDVDLVAEEAALTALIYIDTFFKLRSTKLKKECVEKLICCASKASAKLGSLALRISEAFVSTMKTILELDFELGNALNIGKSEKLCSREFISCKNPAAKCDL